MPNVWSNSILMNILLLSPHLLIFMLSEVSTFLFTVMIGQESKFGKQKSDLHYITVVLGKAFCCFNFNQLEEPIFFLFRNVLKDITFKSWTCLQLITGVQLKVYHWLLP